MNSKKDSLDRFIALVVCLFCRGQFGFGSMLYN
jgi:hypothetical protein